MTEDKNNNLQDSFGASGEGHAVSGAVTHQDGDKIVGEISDVLIQSETGNRLLEMAKEQRIIVDVVKNSPSCIYSPVDRKIYVGVPSDKPAAPLRLALDFAAAIRDAEQTFLGFGVPDESVDPVERASMVHAKEIDKLIHQCKVAYELTKTSDTTEILDVIDKMGHSDVYKAYVSERESSE